MPMRNMSRVLVWLLGALLVAMTGCGGEGYVSPNFLKIVVKPANLDIGETAALQAVLHKTDGTTQDVTSTTQWSISNPSLATLFEWNHNRQSGWFSNNPGSLWERYAGFSPGCGLTESSLRHGKFEFVGECRDCSHSHEKNQTHHHLAYPQPHSLRKSPYQ